jgi:hypothetical protein
LRNLKIRQEIKWEFSNVDAIKKLIIQRVFFNHSGFQDASSKKLTCRGSLFQWR